MVSEGLLEFATERQAIAVRAYLEHGSYAKAAKAIGIDKSSFHNLIKRVKRQAAIRGYSPQHDMTRIVPEGYVVKGVSTYYDEEGKPRGQWVKSAIEDQKRLELVREAIDELKNQVKPIKPIKRSGEWDQPEELLDFYVLSDIHIGALSWGEETGANWDINIATRTIVEAFKYQIECSSPAKHGFFCQLGDALHYDSMFSVTPTSGHVVDADSRPHKMVRAAIHIFRSVIDMLLAKHDTVTVLHASGNHDLFSSIWLQETFAALYANNPRCQVVVNPSPYYAFKHGRTFLGVHHGHKANMQKLIEIFGGKRYWEMKGDCRMAYIHTGHRHHREVKEFNGGIVEMHQTLAAPSSHESNGGYDADRSMACITYHTDGQEIARTLYYPRVSA
jgi:hypothetical protein